MCGEPIWSAGRRSSTSSPIWHIPTAIRRPQAASRRGWPVRSCGWCAQVPPEQRPGLRSVLASDPRPRYQDDPQRVYGMAYGGRNIRFRVEGDVLTVLGVEERL